MSLTRAYNDAVHTYRVKHARSFQYYPGAADGDMSAIDKAAALFVAGVKALAEAVDGTDLINGDVNMAHCIASALEGFAEALPNDSATYAYVDAICSLTAAEPGGSTAPGAQSQLAA
ncbi:hypothetical protein [Asticcacaulis benevestitus]|uniref:Uncharacterized protein n=1 Tax=Asticcacaulis benevestitus DSM 16100 = ATCC BAA-896 TaxID=1121022 RepID=V4NXR5_9CAUL|nr:hypothetical protein [Asticcacaulis benevestitus]ESQ77925.1 hypothetical protein ABENE_23230 [Asticcacaulis benevestitus DSM 16100 = ATCC BAA-896]